MKPGWKTTEFWLSLATSLWAVFGHMLPPPAQAAVVSAASVGYAISRAVTKSNALTQMEASSTTAWATGGPAKP
jgi:hypothetical protein